ncbi:MAG: branched-chain amino acid ABC transporter permease [Alphaproteobacteria bacterium]|nr:branched-chain amino acid ABC transporter permease [Alphaproteobacteria bacterium]
MLSQSVLSGLFLGGMYGLIGLGLGLSWGLLGQINLTHFGFVFLSAYLCYHLTMVWGVDPLLTLGLLVPAFFAVGVVMQWALARFRVSTFNSLLVTFGLTVMIEALIQKIWTADFRKLQTGYGEEKFSFLGLYAPLPELLTLTVSAAAAGGIWLLMRYTDLGKAMRAMAEDAPIAAAFGVNARALALLLSGSCVALAAIAGVFFALSFTLTPTQIFSWVGVVFAAVMMGGLGNPLGPLLAGLVIGVSEALAMAVFSPSWAPIVSFSLLIVLLLFRPAHR